MEEFKGSPSSLVADVDCTAAGESLCQKHEVQGYPTIKYGEPHDMKKYQGGRSYDDFKKFAEENLGPTCGPANLELCDEKTKKKIEDYVAMGAEKVKAKIEKAEKAVKDDVPILLQVLARKKVHL
eukprot:TRINITY_DN1455_c0_g1_i1.p1 TRINITY_DN1455_c0_g1~~TRINITY_DN1455_c0_g1_i1.p1  ORF type:complete len:125 (+),score=43.34 TRINITY_DN1455_c0_g1_i1:246-620(+)